jgi:hypothetical protein
MPVIAGRKSRSSFGWLCICYVALRVLAGCATSPLSENATVRIENDWEAVFIRSDGWTGADGAATVPLPNHRTLWLFGDSWIGPARDGRHIEGNSMVNNTIAISAASPTPPWPDEIRFLWGTKDGKPAAWAIPTQKDEWFWPASGGAIAPGPDGKDRLLLFMARIARLDNSDSVWNFDGRGSSLIIVRNPADEPERWDVSQATLNSYKHGEPPITWGAAVVVIPGDSAPDVLIYGIDGANGFNKKVLLARAPAATAEHMNTWRYHTASGWSAQQSAATPIVQNVAGELTVCPVQIDGSRVWVMIHSEPPLGAGIMARTAPAPEGPWSEAAKIYTCPEPAIDPKMMIYSAKAHPELSRPGELLISYSVNSTDFWDIVAHADKYRPRFVRVPVTELRPR